MKSNIKLAVLSIISTLFLSRSMAQEEGTTIVTSDLETWSKVGLKFKVHKKFTIQLDQGLRLNNNSTIADQYFTDLGFKYKATKNLKFGVGLRYIGDRGGNDLFDNDFRINLDAIFKHKVKSFDFQYRLRYQNKNEMGLSTVDGDYYKNYFRIKAGLKYNIKNWKFDPVFSTELYRDMTKVTGGFDNLRLTLGTSYKMNKFGTLGMYYRVEQELAVSYPKTTYIVGLNYVFTINKKK